MTKGLTTIAALPGSGAGHMSALSAEVAKGNKAAAPVEFSAGGLDPEALAEFLRCTDGKAYGFTLAPVIEGWDG